jgi:catechol 2,3-dioxygenase-like lactoylglutathione lyase family enzyme
MSIEALGYVGVRAKSLEDWSGFGEKFLGMQLVDKSRNMLAFRMDDRKQRLVVTEDGGEGVGFFGWEVADAATLDRFSAGLEEHGVAVTRGSRALADERRVKDLITFSDPLGNRLEVFHGAECTSEPFKPGRNISGFRTGPLGMVTPCCVKDQRCYRSIATCSASAQRLRAKSRSTPISLYAPSLGRLIDRAALASSDGRALQSTMSARLRPCARRRRAHRRHPRTAHQ